MLACGPFRFILELTPPIALDCRVILHPDFTYDALDYFAYGGSEFHTGTFVHSIHSYVSLPSSIPLATISVITEISSTKSKPLRGDPRFKDGVY